MSSPSRTPRIAIVGMAGRFPGADNVEVFWQNLCAGVESTRFFSEDELIAAGVPPELVRDPHYVKAEPVLDGVDQFDAPFFQYSPREAALMDPQQRLFLECAWEALEDAGCDPSRFAGSIGLYAGQGSNFDSYCRAYHEVFRDYIGGSMPHLGNDKDYLTTRASFKLNLRGPSIAVQTACSSSLVAVHLACQSLLAGECDIAMAGGVTVRVPHRTGHVYEEGNIRSRDGHCRVFDARATGTVFGSGVGLVVLRPLDDALRDGDRVYAVIRGSAVNNDGGDKLAFTATSVPQQAAAIAEALGVAGTRPETIGYVEAHGTATTVGDPLEFQALVRAFGTDPAAGSCVLGSVKANVGHLQSAAGVAGLIKAALALYHRRRPPTILFETPNPKIDFAGSPFRIETELTPWAGGPRPRRACVNSLGIGGTNAHVVLEEPPPLPPPGDTTPPGGAHLLPLSAKSPEALQQLAGRYQRWLSDRPDVSLADVCFTAGVGRSHLEHRAALVVDSAEQARGVLSRLEAGRGAPGLFRGQGKERPRVAWLFPGGGVGFPGMARRLARDHETFRRTLERCSDLLAGELPRPLLEAIFGDEELLGQSAYAGPASFAVQAALAGLWQSWGVEPYAVFGHGLGQYGAAYVARVFSLEEGLGLVAHRGRLLSRPSEGEAMAALFAPAGRVEQACRARPPLAVAADHGAHFVVRGPALDIDDVVRRFRAEGLRCHRLSGNPPWPSPSSRPDLESFEAAAARVDYQPARRHFVCSLTGQARDPGQLLDATYWRRQASEPVQWARGVETLTELGCSVLLELGPGPALLGLAASCWPEHTPTPALIPAARPGRPDAPALVESLARLYARGLTPDFAALHRPRPRRKQGLPTYPFQRKPYWVESEKGTPRRAGLRPLIDRMTRSPALRQTLFETEYSVAAIPILADHRVGGSVVSPGACHLAMVLAAAETAWSCQAPEITDVVFPEPLLVPEDGSRSVQLVFTPRDGNDPGGGADFRLISVEGDASKTHATGEVRYGVGAHPLPPRVALEELRRRSPEEINVTAAYDRAGRQGISFGPRFRWLGGLWQGEGEALGRLELPEALGGLDGHLLHPALLDACLQVGSLAGEDDRLRLPFAIGRLRVHSPARGRLWWCHARAVADHRWDLVLTEEDGQVVAEIFGYETRAASVEPWRGWLYGLRWPPRPPEAVEDRSGLAGGWFVVGDAGAGEALVSLLRDRGADASRVTAGEVTTARPLPVAGRSGVVYLGFGREDDAATETAPERATRLCSEVLLLVQALAEVEPAPRLWLVTRGGQATGHGDAADVDPSQSALWGLTRTIQLEEPRLRCTGVDLDDAGVGSLLEELSADDVETQVAYRGGVRHVARLAHLHLPAGTEVGPSVRVQLAEYGSADRLLITPVPRKRPGAGEVEVEVHAAGLNFRDVLNCLGMLQTYYAEHLGISRASQVPLGFECAGVVSAVGAGVTGRAVGDRVMAMSTGSLARYVVLPAAAAAPIPPDTTFEQAATIPVAFLTSWYALIHCAAVRAGERVLIHAAAGGVGQAAVQIAQAVGAEVLATASPGKWAFLRDQGVAHVWNSRTLDFAEAITALAGGPGVEVVLNSLNGAFIERSLDVMRQGGRFVELGKLGAWDAARVATRRPDVAYQPFDLGEEVGRDSSLLPRLWEEVCAEFAAGRLRPLAHTVFPVQEVGEAFRCLQQAKVVGKVVVSFESLLGRFVRADASYLVTGGVGALGLRVAQWLADQGARHIVLNGRRGQPGDEARQALDRLRAGGVEVQVVAADVSRRDEVSRLLAACEHAAPLRGLVHASGVLDDAVLLEQTPERLARVLGPKAQGAWHLHELTRDRPLDFFVTFSSSAALLGSAGQSNYAAANAFLDGLMERRRGEGRPGLSIAWGPWAGGGMAADLESRLLAQGIGMIPPGLGIEVLEQLLRQAMARHEVGATAGGLTVNSAQVGVLPVDWPAFGRRHAGGRVPPALAGLIAPDAAANRPAAAGPDWRGRLGRLPAADRPPALARYVADRVAAVLRLSAPPDHAAGFTDLGLDSLMAVELRNRLNADLDPAPPLAATALFDYPNVAALADQLARRLAPPAVATAAAAPAASSPPPAADPVGAGAGAVAVIGMACRFPGADDVAAFWSLLDRGGDAVAEIPPDRFDIAAYYDPDPAAPGKACTRRGGFLDRVDRFDPQFFGIAPREAAAMDPQHRLLLEAAWEALEHAGVAPARVHGTRAGVYLGLCTSDYLQLAAAAGPADAYVNTGNAHSTAAGRISHLLGLRGPCLVLDTACSSSLVAVHQAARDLLAGDADLALAGGANVILSPATLVAFSQARMLAPDGRCKAFDAAADGYARSEGCGVVVLKRLADADRDGDRVLAVVRGTAVNHDGASGGLTVPNGPAQERVIRDALSRAGVAASAVDYLEAHGTGTGLGDPIEVRAAAAALGEGRGHDRPLLIGSVKTNIGHLEAAAGIAGLIKVVLAMGHGVIPRHLHFRNPNPHIPWDGLAVRVAAAPTPWPGGAGGRVAAVSSFGMSGTNAHLVVASPPPAAAPPSQPPPDRTHHLLPLSARTAPALRDLAGRYLAWLDGGGGDGWADAGFTAGAGRNHFEHRAAVAVGPGVAVRPLLEAVRDGRPARGVRAGRAAERPRAAWLFGGVAPPPPALVRRLVAAYPAFRAALDRCAAAVDCHWGGSLRDALLGGGAAAAGGPGGAAWEVPAGVAVAVAMAQLWEDWGLAPDVAIGHGAGHYAAACAAGALTPEEAARLAAGRARLAAAAAAARADAAVVFAPAGAIEAACRAHPGVARAADHGAHAVLAGPAPALAEALRGLARRGARWHRLPGPAAAAAVGAGVLGTFAADALGAFAADADAVTCRSPRRALVCGITGRVLDAAPDAGYWVRQAAATVPWARGVRTLWELGCGALLEVTPGPALAGLAAVSWPGPVPPACAVPVRRGAPGDDDDAMVGALARLYAAGITPDFDAWDRPWPRRKLALPTYPFQRQRYWISDDNRGTSTGPRGPAVTSASAVATGQVRRQLEQAPPGQRRGLLQEHLQETAGQILHLPASQVDPAVGFFDMGMDSLMATEFHRRLEASLGQSLSVTVSMDRPRIADLVDSLLADVLGLQGATTAPVQGPPAGRDHGGPIALVGLSCRLPGAEDGPAFWRLLETGGDAVRDVPGDRWDVDAYYDPDPEVVGKMYTRRGGFLDQVDRFDPSFFGISPREAVSMDPQQRLLLEVAWEALENAGIAADRLAGSRTGVFVGMTDVDYAGQSHGDLEQVDVYSGTGTGLSFTAGRLSYVLGLRGPSLAIDTACSSSLVGVHQACQSLRSGECDLALAAGVHVIVSPAPYVFLSRARALAPDGRCKAFDAAADGYARSEGCGVVVLKRLADADRDGDRVLAVVRGTAVNHDGASGGLTVPNGPAQERVIRDALSRAGVAASAVDYLEAHGTGTGLGDPIEVRAAAAALGEGRGHDRPLLIGSVKTNIGHLEAAAGIAGLIKVVLAMGHGVIPRSLHFRNPNRYIPWDRIPVKVVSEPTPWPAGARPRVAGVSSFGMGGTNAHVVLEAPPEPYVLPGRRAPDRSHHVLVLSGKSESALRDQAGRYLAWLDEHPHADLADVCFTAGAGRRHFDHRAAMVLGSFAHARTMLEALRAGKSATGLLTGHAPKKPKVAWLFTGQGSQYPGMAHELYRTQPAFAAVLNRCESVTKRELDGSLLGFLAREEEAPDETEWAQPALFAVELGLARLWQHWGMEPDVLLGYGIGQYVAACTAGVLSEEDGLRLVAERGILTGTLPAGGAMAAVFAPEDVIQTAIRGDGRLSVAAYNGRHAVLSGAASAVEDVVARFELRGVRCQRLGTSHAFNSPLLERVLGQFEAFAAGVEARAPQYPLVCNLSGHVLPADQVPGAAYWRRQEREPVQFDRGVKTISELGCQVLLEVGPHPALIGMAASCWTGRAPTAVASLRRGRPETRTIAWALARLHVAGLTPDFAAWDRPWTRRKLDLPTYPFQRQRYWVEATRPALPACARPPHPLLGTRQELASGDVVYSTELNCRRQPWLRDHRVFDAVVVPGTMTLGMVLATSGPPCRVAEVNFLEALVLQEDDGAGREVQLVIKDSDADRQGQFQVFSRASAQGGSWTLHARGRFESVLSPARPDPPESLTSLKSRLTEESANGFYECGDGTGVEYGPAFQGVRAIWAGAGEVLGEIVAPEALQTRGLPVHPAFLDACLHVLGRAGRGPSDAAYVPFELGRFEVWHELPRRIYCHARLGGAAPDHGETLTADMWLLDESGQVLGRIAGLVLKRATRRTMLAGNRSKLDDWLYEVEWREQDRAGGAPAANFLPGVETMAATVRAGSAGLMDQTVLGREAAELGEELETLGLEYLIRALSQLGWSPTPGERVRPGELSARLGIVSTHRKLVGRILQILSAGGWLAREQAGWRVVRTFPAGDPERRLRVLLERFPSGRIELALLARCGSQLADVLGGRTDPLGLLFPSEGLGADDLYRDAAVVQAFYALIRQAIEVAAADLPPGRRLRILEVGAGTGGMTSSVLPALPANRTEYHYTDISAGFFAEAEQRFSQYPYISFRVLDLERDPVAQGFASHHYDLVLASNVLHATRDLRQTLAHVRKLLAPRGWLLMLEGLQPRIFLDLTFGLLGGWWRFEDDVRVDYALLNFEGWSRLLRRVGFGETVSLAPGQIEQQAVIVAQGPDRPEPPPEQAGVWLILTDDRGVGEALASRLNRDEQTCVLVGPGAPFVDPAPNRDQVRWEDPAAWDRLLAESLPPDTPLRGVVHLWSLDSARTAEASAEDLAEDVYLGCGSTLALVQALARRDRRPTNGLWLVTRGAQVTGGDRGGALGQSPLWGLGKVVALEHPELACRRLDLDAAGGLADQVEALAAELLSAGEEDQVSLRGGRRLVPRLRRAPRSPLPPDGDFRLEKSRDRTIGGLHFKPLSLPRPGAGEVQVDVRAAGLNFHDVLDALGMLPVDAGPLGSEFAGRVVTVGEGVTGFAAGDEVVGFGSGVFGNRTNAPACLVARRPADLNPVDASTIPVAFSTAQIAFQLARVRSGDRVLIHAAAGGVGMAAVGLARALGAEVFGTAGLSKHDEVRRRGVLYLYNSRSPDFGRQLLEDTGGRGVDVVLNSLTGEGFIEATLGTLARGGRFVEIGKRGIWTPGRLAAVRPDVAYHVLALDRLILETPGDVGQVLRDLMGRFAGGELTPLPRTTFPLAAAPAAFVHMQRARHVGKVVLEVPPFAARRLRSDGTYLVTGGLGGLGLEVARWLVDRGARHLVLNGRRAPDAEAQAVLSELRQAGAEVRVVLGDVARESDVRLLLDRADEAPHPLVGVIHSAGVLNDAAVLNQDWARFDEVLRPKVLGAWHLDRLTRGRPLELFVLFSSVAALTGSRGQANHAAANMFLDQLARDRRARGRPAVSINWGPWSRVGAAARRDRRLATGLEELGLGWITPAQGLQSLELVLSGGGVQVGVVAVDWAAFGRQFAAGKVPPFFGELVASPGAGRPPARPPLELHRFPGEIPLPVLVDYVSGEVMRVLRLPRPPDPDSSFLDLGMDSLMSVELRNRLESGLRVPVPAAVLLQNPGVARLAAQLRALLPPPSAAASPSADSSPPAAALEYSPLVPIRTGGSRPPFFCVHPWGGVLYPYYELARLLGPDQPFYGLQSAGLYATPDKSVEEMSERYLEAIRAVQPAGPYLLGGWSFGGLVAFEMARRLNRDGDEVAFLAVLDQPVTPRSRVAGAFSMARFIVAHAVPSIWPYVYDYFEIKSGMGGPGGAGRSREDGPPAGRVPLAALLPTLGRELGSLRSRDSTLRRVFSVIRHNFGALSRYRPLPYDGRLTLLRTQSFLAPDERDPTGGWGRLAAGGVEVRPLPGRHLGILYQPHVREVASQLSAGIEGALGGAPGPRHPRRRGGGAAANGVPVTDTPGKEQT